MEDALADKSSESEVAGEDDIDSSARWGGRDSGRPLRPQAFAMGGFDSGTHSFAHILSCHSSHGQGRESSPSESLSFRARSRIFLFPEGYTPERGLQRKRRTDPTSSRAN